MTTFWFVWLTLCLAWSVGCLAHAIAAGSDALAIAVHAGFTVFWLSLLVDRIARRR